MITQQDKKNIDKKTHEKEIKDLINENPEIALAQKIMKETRKTVKVPITIDQTNRYKIPSFSQL